MKHQVNFFKNTIKILFCVLAITFFVNCEDSFKFDLPETGSIEDTALPAADFSYIPNATNFKVLKFTNLSTESTDYLWDFGDAGVVCDTTTVDGVHGVIVCGTESTTTQKDPAFVKFSAGEGTYPVTLTSSDKNSASNAVTIDVPVVDVFVPLPVTVLNGDFDGGRDNWEIDSFTGGTTTSFNTSSDGSPLLYDGSDSGSTKTAGAKWTSSTSKLPYTSASRYAYQPIIVSPTTPDREVKYILEFEYAIKSDVATDPTGGRRVVAEILDGHFTDGADARNSTPLATHIGNVVKGKGDFETAQLEFTTNASGEVAIWIYAYTPVDAYVDNVKVYPRN